MDNNYGQVLVGDVTVLVRQSPVHLPEVLAHAGGSGMPAEQPR
jgi:hypothetical protein